MRTKDRAGFHRGNNKAPHTQYITTQHTAQHGKQRRGALAASSLSVTNWRRPLHEYFFTAVAMPSLTKISRYCFTASGSWRRSTSTSSATVGRHSERARPIKNQINVVILTGSAVRNTRAAHSGIVCNGQSSRELLGQGVGTYAEVALAKPVDAIEGAAYPARDGEVCRAA